MDKELFSIYTRFLKNMLISKVRKSSDIAGLSSGAFFWERNFHELHIRNPDVPPYGLLNECKESIRFALKIIAERFLPPFRCIDVGCGPTSQFYSLDLKCRSDLLIVCVDPLAETYKRLHDRYNTGYDIECIRGFGEKLYDLFDAKTFHLAYSQNAIDHCQSPEEFLTNLFYVLKPGGMLVLYGFIKEGSATGWLGLHQWDIEIDNGHILLSNKSKTINKKDISERLDMRLRYQEITGHNIKDTYTLIYEKM